MPTLNTLREQRAAKIDRAKAISATSERENRDLDAGELLEFNAIKTEIDGLDARMSRASAEAEWDRRAAPADPAIRAGDLRGYSVAKALTEGLAGSLTGLEREAHEELSRGREARGIMVPVDALLEVRALLTTAPTGAVGGNLVVTDLAALTDRRRPMLMVEALGATVLRGLTGNLDLPRLANSGQSYWIAEHAATTRSDVGFRKKSMTPKTVSAEYEVSRRMMLQSQFALEPILRADLGYLLAQALDAAAIKGGGAGQPVGILADTNVTTIANATISAGLTADLMSALELDDVTGTRAFLTHPAVLNKVRKLVDTQGHVITTAETFNGERVESSNQVPVTTVGPPVKYPLIYGEWASLYIGYWSGVDILMNPYHTDVASKGGVLIHAFLDADVCVRHPEGFRWTQIN